MKFRQYAHLDSDARSVLAVIAGGAATLIFLLVWFGFSQWQKYDNTLKNIEPRVARLLGNLESRDETAAAWEEIAESVSRYAYRPQGDLSRAESEFQSRVRDILQASALEIVNTQQLPARSGNGYDEISLNLTANGSLSQLQEALTMLRAETPRIRIEHMRLQPLMRGGPEVQRLSMQMTLAAVRLREI